MPAATATQAHKESKPDLGEITIVVHGGLIDTVNFPPELEGRVTVRVEDEDVDRRRGGRHHDGRRRSRVLRDTLLSRTGKRRKPDRTGTAHAPTHDRAEGGRACPVGEPQP